MDIGPHFVTFPKESELTKEIKELMNGDLISIPNIYQEYRVYFRNSVLKKYPTLYEIIFKKGLKSFIQSLLSFFASRIKQKSIFDFPSTKEYLIYNYGNYLYKTWFKPYLDFSYSETNIPVEFIRKRFPLLNFKDIIQKTRKRTKKENGSINSSPVYHWYFKYGIGTLANTLSEKIKDQGGKIILGVDVKNIEHNKIPKEVLIIKDNTETKIKADIIIYTTPSNVTKKWFNELQEMDFKSSRIQLWCFYSLMNQKLLIGGFLPIMIQIYHL